MSGRPELSRRQVIETAGIAGAAFLVGCGRSGSRALDRDVDAADAATCVLTPERTEGPYFVDERLRRSDIRGGQDGVELALTMYVFDAKRDCAPVEGAQVDIWHSNAAGRYSDEAANGTTGQTWLRGYQTTDARGRVRFTTIWPGWYPGRCVHIHFKVRVAGLEFTSQLFFTDAANAKVFQSAPYASRGNPDTTDGQDAIYGSDGSSLTLHPQSDGAGGYAADFSVGVGGGSGGGTTDTKVAAFLRSKTMVRTANGHRHLRLGIEANERVTARARLTRDGEVLTHAKKVLLPGTRRLTLDIPQGVEAGAANLRLLLTDSRGNTKTIKRAVHVRERATG